ncbi:hypothetical protein U91I_01832 [alpha proteobacterium U9-1i]|nr:hypothetical protein U91I_01832 [alpha proteobacterium U9-1i]
MRNQLRAAAVALGVCAFGSAPASSNEGLWTFDNFPTARMQQEVGWAPDRAWLDRVMAGSARLPGCSGSNVSEAGLILTNHHCVIACVNALSSANANYIRDGFMARTREEERRCAGASIQVLERVTDVTPRLNTATATIPADGFAAARDAEIARIEAPCNGAGRFCQVVTLYQGGRYALYEYKRYDDVRLVFAPEYQIAAFGGDPDNYNFPRYCLDFAFLRVYENGAPAVTPQHLSMRFTPVEDNEVVLATGNPGVTSRSLTAAELAFARDHQLPWTLVNLAETRGRLLEYSMRGPEQERIASNALQGVENLIKRFGGQREALVNGWDRVTARETDLRARIARNRAAARDVGDAWGEIERAQEAYRGMFYEFQMLEASAAPRSTLFFWARDIVRAAEEREKPDAARMPRYTQARMPAVERGVLASQPVYSDFEQLNLSNWLMKLREYLTVDNPNTRLVLGRESPEGLAARLSQSRLADPAYRAQLWNGGAAAVATSDDPMIVFVRTWDAQARAVRARSEREVAGPVAQAHERIARARFRAFGDAIYPDATGTPRITYGRVSGWSEHGRTIPAFTRIGGLYERATGAAPFALTQRWIDAQSRLDPQTIYNLASTTETVGGASGSPLLDREGRVVGASFDGNSHSTGGAFYYDVELNRAVTVASTAIEATLQHVYGMDALLAELRAP